jgi:hypothetical protein
MRGSHFLRRFQALWRGRDRDFTEPLAERPELWPPRHPNAERLAAVLGEAYRRGGRKPEEQIRELLDQELQAAGLSYPQDDKDHFVRSLAAEPPWLVGVLLAPFHRRKHEAELRALEADAQPPEDPEIYTLAERLSALPGVARVSWDSFDRDRVLYVRLHPWSDATEETEEQVRQAAAPRVVRFTD